MKKLFHKPVFIALVPGLFFIACNNNKDGKPEDVGGMRMPDKYRTHDSIQREIPLDALLKPVNEYVLTTVPVTTVQTNTEEIEVPALGVVQYDYRQAGTIAARITGRIEKLYVQYRYQYIRKGEKVMEIYSPELLTSQQNLLFLIKNDPENTSLIQAARQRLLLLGMSNNELNQIENTGKPIYNVSVFSNYSGYVTDLPLTNAPSAGMQPSAMGGEPGYAQTTEPISLKEGMYVDAGQSLFTVVNTSTALVALNIAPTEQSLVNVGDPVSITAETFSESIRTTIAYIEPFYSGETRSLAARAYINNATAKIPIGSQVQATIFSGAKKAGWLPEAAVLSLGLNEIVFKKEGPLFQAHQVATGIRQDGKIQILSGLTPSDSVAVNAQFLVENESFIQINK